MMELKWSDSLNIALALIDQYPEQDPLAIRFTDLFDWVQALEEFDDDPKNCNERILEAIQLCWIDEND